MSEMHMQHVLGLHPLELGCMMDKHLSITAMCQGRHHNIGQHLVTLTPQFEGYMLASTPPH